MVKKLRSMGWFSFVFMHLLMLSAVDSENGTLWGQEPTKKPNIIYILADDLGWTDTGAYGSQYYETPNIDRLTASGMKFTAYHNCQNCQPTRAALMTGQYSPRTGVYTVGGIDRFDWKSRPLRQIINLPLLEMKLMVKAILTQH